MADFNRNLPATTGEKAVQVSAPQLDFSGVPLPVLSRAASIAAEIMANGGSITPPQALAAAYHFYETGEVIGRHAYVGTKGNVAGRVLEGYRGVARKLDMSKYQWRYRPPTPDEMARHHIGPQDRMTVCELDVLAARRQCIEMGVEYQPIIGVSIVRQGDKINSPAFRDSVWLMEKQARVDALRQVGEQTSGDEDLEEAEAHGVDVAEIRAMQENGAVINQEQMAAAIDKAVIKQAQAARTPEEIAADEQAEADKQALLEMQNKFRSWAYDCAMGDETPCPGCGALYGLRAHTAECIFRLIAPNLALLKAPEPEQVPEHLQGIQPLRDGLRATAATVNNPNAPATERQRTWITAAMTLLSDKVEEREAFMDWLWGFEQDELTVGQAKAIYEWSGVEKRPDGEYAINEQCRKDWQVVMSALNTK